MSQEMERSNSEQRVMEMIADAFTRAEYNRATDALVKHYRRFPEDRRRDLGHVLAQSILYLEQRERQGESIGLSAPDFARREEIFRRSGQVAWEIDPFADPEGAVLKLRRECERLGAWLRRFPSDDLTQEVLAMREAELLTNQRIAEAVLDTQRLVPA